MMRYSTKGIALRIFLTCWLVYVLHFATNTVREIYPALSLGDHFSFDVSEYLGMHPDIFAIPGRGAFINNNPGASILGAIPYGITRPVISMVVQYEIATRARSQAPMPAYNSSYPMAREFFRMAYERGYDIKFGLAAGVMQSLLMAPLAALSVVVMFFILRRQTGSQRKALAYALIYAFATPVFYRVAQLNHNLLQALFAFFSFALLWHPGSPNARLKSWRWLLAGLLLGWTLVLDYSGLVLIFALGLYGMLVWLRTPPADRKFLDLALFAGGVAGTASVLLLYQWLAFGNPLYPAQQYMPATAYSGIGYRGMSLPQLDLLWENAFGARYGLFTSAPFLILAFFVPAWLGSRRLVPKLETAAIVFLTGGMFLFTAANQFSRLQFNSGIRHVVPVVPFLFLLAVTVFDRLPRRLGWVFGLASVYWSWCLAMYRDVEQGSGILESLIHITTGGPQLPWLEVLHKMGYLSQVPSWLPLALGFALVWGIWSLDIRRASGKWVITSPLFRNSPRLSKQTIVQD